MKIRLIVFLLTTFIMWISKEAKAQDYCTAAGSPGTTNDHIVRVQLYDINNASGQTGYSDFTDISTDIAVEGTYELKVYLGTVFDLDSAFAWIDFNQNFIFEHEEAVDMQPFEGVISTGTFTVPVDASLGETRLRVRNVYSDQVTNDPCNDYFGEVEDYTVNIMNIDCPNAGEACDDGRDCTTNTVVDFNCNCRGDFVDTDLDGICDEEDRCPGQDDLLDINGNGIPDGCEDYCPAAGSPGTGGDYINKVRIYDLYHSSLQSGYSDFTNINVELAHEASYNLFVHLNAVFPNDTMYAWIDFNQDFIFQDNEEITMSLFDADGISSGVVTVPSDALLGPTRMRVRNVWTTAPLSFQQCNDYFGEVEDYTVTIITNDCPNVGETCDDGMVCSINDRIDANCKCRGEIEDDDLDGVCNDLDECPGADDLADLNNNGVLDCKDYCIAGGSDQTGNSFITNFVFDGMSYPSNQSSYSDFTDVVIEITQGESATMEVHLFDVNLDDGASVWADFNQNRIFEIEEEMIMFEYDDSISLGAINVPEEALLGETVLRVRNITGPISDPCFVYPGEVEDYTLLIKSDVAVENTDINTLKVYPNPTTNILYLSLDASVNKGAIEIHDAKGVLQHRINQMDQQMRVDVSAWNKGMYIISSYNEGKSIGKYKVIIF